MNARPTASHATTARTQGPGPDGLYVEESGTPGSPAIVFIHGAGQSSREWRQHMDRLSGFHCLAPDLPGFGRSNHLGTATKERVADLIARLIEERVPAKRASVVGISSGGLHTHALLDRHPDRVERAFIDGSPPFGTPRIGRAIMRMWMLTMAPFIHTRPLMALFSDTHDPDDLRVASRLEFGRVVGECFGEYAALDVPSPALLIAGEKEGIVRSMNAALAQVMPVAEAMYVPGLGHCWQKADPDLHIRTVEAWVSGQELPSELRREAAPSPAKVEQVRRMGPEFWYVRHKGRLMREVRLVLRHYKPYLVEAHGKVEAEAILREALQGFEASLAELPYVGGDENPNTRALYIAAAWLAMYRALQARGASVEDAGRIIYLGTASFYESIPARWLMRWQGRRFFGRKRMAQRRRDAVASQRRRYPDDWVFEIVAEDGRDSAFGADYSECGIVKYLDREGASELAPYLCWVDYPMAAAAKVRLDRTETLAQGGQRCDFRFTRREPVHVEPEFLHTRPESKDRGAPDPARPGRGQAMQHMHLDARIEAPVEHVWEFLCDTSRWDEWDPRHSHTDFSGALDDVGTSWNEASKLMGFEMKTAQEVVEVEPQRLLHYHSDSGPAEVYYRLDAEGDTTRFTFDCDFELPSRMPRVIRSFMLSRANRYPQQALAGFKALAEAKAAAQTQS